MDEQKSDGGLFHVTVGHANHEHPHRDKNGFALKLGETIGEPECPLMRRWVLECPLGSFRIHHFLKSDDDRALHSHPWWFITLPLKGGYADITYCDTCPERSGKVAAADGSLATCPDCNGSGYRQQAVKPFHPKFRPSNHVHAVVTDDCWTLIITGRKINPWGFFTKAGKFFESRKYFGLFGHAPCE